MYSHRKRLVKVLIEVKNTISYSRYSRKIRDSLGIILTTKPLYVKKNLYHRHCEPLKRCINLKDRLPLWSVPSTVEKVCMACMGRVDSNWLCHSTMIVLLVFLDVTQLSQNRPLSISFLFSAFKYTREKIINVQYNYIAKDWIRTADLWWQKQPICQLSHNLYCPIVVAKL